MSTWNCKELKEKAKLRLKANYWKAVLVGLITVLIGGTASVSEKFSSSGSSAETSGAAGSSIAGAIPPIPLAGIIAIGIFAVVFAICRNPTFLIVTIALERTGRIVLFLFY